MARQTADRETVCQRVPPPGESIPINVDPFELDDSVPQEPDIRVVAKGLRNGRASDVSGMTAEPIKE